MNMKIILAIYFIAINIVHYIMIMQQGRGVPTQRRIWFSVFGGAIGELIAMWIRRKTEEQLTWMRVFILLLFNIWLIYHAVFVDTFAHFFSVLGKGALVFSIPAILWNILGFFLVSKNHQAGETQDLHSTDHFILLIALSGGSIGVYIGIKMFGYRKNHPYFQFGIPLFFIFNLLLLYSISDFILPTLEQLQQK